MVGNATRPYGAPNPAFTSTVSGALNGDTFTHSYSTTATITSPVGNYPINDAVGGPAASNYTIHVMPGTLTITQASVALNVAANNATRAYGAANPAFTSTITGALNGDTFTITYATTATATSPVGTYPIVPTVSGAAAGNYTVTTRNGVLSVTPATLTVTANNATRGYGVANPVFTGTTTGLLNGDTVTTTFASAAVVNSPVGTYPIVPTVSGAATSNYTVITVNGTLTITQNPSSLVINVDNATRRYGAPNPNFTGTVTGVIPGRQCSRHLHNHRDTDLPGRQLPNRSKRLRNLRGQLHREHPSWSPRHHSRLHRHDDHDLWLARNCWSQRDLHCNGHDHQRRRIRHRQLL